ncbi:hypothetical protein [Marinobacter halotolerans]|uniref:hypothetical protein n=1 Tax=Marinobacter halotolerans TaxID=1569211 RepID=UPI0012460598|nr:hypothetical protein [Marinobacter halotolerans]
MDSILSAINDYRIILGAIVLTLIALILIKYFWEQVSFHVLRMKMNAPLFGKIKKLAKNPARDDAGWFHSEKDLCSEFEPFYKKVDKGPEYYDNCKNYLSKVGELGRKNLGFFGWLAISIMVFIEAMGFSYVLAGFTIPGASESLQQQGAIGIAILISGLLVAFTHFTGHELHKNQLVKTVRVWWRQDNDQPNLAPRPRVKLENDYEDDNDPAWRMMLSRLSTNAEVTPAYWATIGTVIFVVLVAIGSTYVRGQVLESEAMEQHRSQTSAGPVASSDDPYATAVPPDLVESQQETDAAVEEGITNATLKGGWATFIVLAVIFIFLQALGVLIGYKTGFAGKESGIAHKYTRKFNTRDEFEAHHERKRNLVVQIAQRNLTKLQALMAKKLSQVATDKGMLKTLEGGNNRTFLAYNHRSTTEQGHHDVNEAVARNDRDTKLARVSAPRAQQASPAQTETAQPAPAPEANSPGDSHGLEESEIQQWMDKLGWERQRTIDLLIKQREKKAAQAKPEVSEEDALRMMEESNQ